MFKAKSFTFVAPLVMAVGLVSEANATPVTIDFDTLGSGVAVEDQFAADGVTFVNTQTNSFGALAGGSSPIAISSLSSGTFFGPSDAIIANFSEEVTSVSVTGLDIGAAGATLSAFDGANGLGSLIDSFTIDGDGLGVGFFDTLSVVGTGIQSVSFSQIFDGGTLSLTDGIVFDNFTFDTTNLSAVPLPAAAPLLLGGIGLLGIMGWRRKRAA